MFGKKTVRKFIEQAAKEGWEELSLSGNQLTSVPPEIAKLTNLTSLSNIRLVSTAISGGTLVS